MRHRLTLFTLILLAMSSLQSAPQEQAGVKIRADCLLEAEAAGLDGRDRKQFVDQCVKDLLEVEIHNLEQG